jgi:aminomethyltransferase
MSDSPLLQTVFHDWHAAHDGRMVEFGGWHMPVQYSTIVAEHEAVRQSVGLFDIAHMGRLWFTGPDACRFLNHLLTNDVSKLKIGQVRYSLVTNERGGILDDVLVYRLDDAYMLVVNASNRLKILDWIATHEAGFDARVEDRTASHPMIALQGPKAIDVVVRLGCADAGAMKYYSAATAIVGGHDAIVSRTGYTGEDGFEVIVAADAGVDLWEQAVAAGAESGLQACGLGCRDTLRLEAAMPLYGHELSETTDPLTAGLHFVVKLEADDFIGRSALKELESRSGLRKRVGLELSGRRIAREGMAVLANGEVIGEVTSGTFSPTLQKPIAMAYVNASAGDAGAAVDIDIRGRHESAVVVELPFYRRG